MDAVLIAAVVVVGVLGGLNLLLMLAVLRRLREYDEKWARAGMDSLAERRLVPEPGTRIADFTATTLDGADITLRDPAGVSGVEGPLLVGFFSTGCPACHEELPRFVEHAGTVPGGREQNLVVISGSADDAADIIEAVSPMARVVVEPVEGPLMTAFSVRGWPSFVLLGQDGTVQAGAGGVATLARSQQAVPV
ncbi:TlpA family protein disulfide reductase [Nonomuraea glycinis]|uniref:TlpA family protein disulfide reductase n=1 Tax=Nonomuraea glycinis TaxID=2047744 RepID=UPI002E10ADC9|nr:TlpA family protein disulfide reductase [Nonomuraea glycinis]